MSGFFDRLVGTDSLHRIGVTNQEDEELYQSRQGRLRALLAMQELREVEDVLEVVSVRGGVVLHHPLVLAETMSALLQLEAHLSDVVDDLLVVCTNNVVVARGT